MVLNWILNPPPQYPPTPESPNTVDLTSKSDHVIYKVYYKLSLVVYHARCSVQPSPTGQIDKWFNMETEQVPSLRDATRIYRSISSYSSTEPFRLRVMLKVPKFSPHEVLVYSGSYPNASLVSLDPPPSYILLETWSIDYTTRVGQDTSDYDPRKVYKQCISLFRSIFTLLHLLPAWKLETRLARRSRGATNVKFEQSVQFESAGQLSSNDLSNPKNYSPVYDLSPLPKGLHTFPLVAHATGDLSISVTWLQNPNFQVIERDTYLSSRLKDSHTSLNPITLPSIISSIADRFVIPPPPSYTPTGLRIRNSNSPCTPIKTPNTPRTTPPIRPRANSTLPRMSSSGSSSPRPATTPVREELPLTALAARLRRGSTDKQFAAIIMGRDFPRPRHNPARTTPDGRRLRLSEIFTQRDAESTPPKAACPPVFRSQTLPTQIAEAPNPSAIAGFYAPASQDGLSSHAIERSGSSVSSDASFDFADVPISHKCMSALETSITSSKIASFRDFNSPEDARITSLLQLVLNSQDQEDALLDLVDHDAQCTLDVIQKLLDCSSSASLELSETIDPRTVPHRLRRLLLKLVLKCDKLPRALFLSDIQLLTTDNYASLGGFSDIFCGLYGTQRVAIKRLRVFQMVEASKRPAIKQAFYHESITWRNLSHRHILSFLGIDDRLFPAAFCMVSPWMENGAVRHTIDVMKNDPKISNEVLFVHVQIWIRGIVLGLAYLHGENVVHGDLRCANILIDSDMEVKLADFGLSVFADGASNNYGSMRAGATRWLAPEMIAPEEFGKDSSRPTFMSDIYSFACVLIELYTGRPAFADLSEHTVIRRVMLGSRPERPRFHGEALMSDSLWSLLNRCWSQLPSDRPTADCLVQELSSIQSRTT